MKPVTGIAGRHAIYPRFLPVGDCALSVEFANAIDPAVNAAVQALDRAVAAADLEGIVETTPTFRSLLVIYEPETIGFDELVEALRGLLADGLRTRSVTGRSWTVPVLYGSPSEDDLVEVAAATGNSRDDVIAIHSSAEYQVYFVGFVPGLPTLGGLPPALHLPRRPVPRLGIPAGSVMIGGMQGLIVPMTMPSGSVATSSCFLHPDMTPKRASTSPIASSTASLLRSAWADMRSASTPAGMSARAGLSGRYADARLAGAGLIQAAPPGSRCRRRGAVGWIELAACVRRIGFGRHASSFPEAWSYTNLRKD